MGHSDYGGNWMETEQTERERIIHERRIHRLTRYGPLTKSDHCWENDSAHHSCAACGKEFSWMLRKHHCRLCGGVRCNDCAPKSTSRPGFVRICKEEDLTLELCDERLKAQLVGDGCFWPPRF